MKLPHRCIPSCLKSGIAPAMKADGSKTYWGTNFDDQLDENLKKMLGLDRELHTAGTNRDDTDARRAALEIIDDSEMQGLNARQILLKHKAAHGSGLDPSFPDGDEIKGCMSGYPPDHWVNIYGDGSYTSPTLWWAALGGYGIWMPKWPQDDQCETMGQVQHSYGTQAQTLHQEPSSGSSGYNESSSSHSVYIREGKKSSFGSRSFAAAAA